MRKGPSVKQKWRHDDAGREQWTTGSVGENLERLRAMVSLGTDLQPLWFLRSQSHSHTCDPCCAPAELA